MKLKNVLIEPGVLLAELVGTFVLVLVAITVPNIIVVGFTMLILVLALGAISGAHVNPAVTFGLWSVKKIETIKVPFYWLMQLVGALLALVVSSVFTGNGFSLSFASFSNLDPKIFFAELIGTAIFVFMVTAAVQRGLADAAKSLAIGLGLLAGLAAGTGLIGAAAQTAATSKAKTPPRVTKVTGITANPAVALASTERAAQTSLTQTADATKTQPSLFTWETILGPLLGGAIGANLFMVSAGVNPFEADKKKSAKATVTTKVTTKGKNLAKNKSR